MITTLLPRGGVGRATLAIALACALSLAPTISAQGKGKGKGEGKGNSEAKGNSEDKGEAKGKPEKFVPPGHRRAPVEVVVKVAPPAVKREVMPARPSPTHVWVAGYWEWQGDYVWMPGVWMLPPEPEVVWVAPRYEQRSGVSIYISGFWRL